MLNIEPPEYLYCPFCGNKLGLKVVDGKKFKYCRECDWTYYPHVGAAACGVAIRKGKVLLVKRARDPYRNTWMFPAGFVNFGEHPEDTILREVNEETGLKAKIIKLLEVEQVDDDPRSMGHFGFFYLVKVRGNIKPKDKIENSDIGWFSLKRLPIIGWHGHKRVLKMLTRDNQIKH
jgi:8-oxo-dGTP diphosphatase